MLQVIHRREGILHYLRYIRLHFRSRSARVGRHHGYIRRIHFRELVDRQLDEAVHTNHNHCHEDESSGYWFFYRRFVYRHKFIYDLIIYHLVIYSTTFILTPSTSLCWPTVTNSTPSTISGAMISMFWSKRCPSSTATRLARPLSLMNT